MTVKSMNLVSLADGNESPASRRWKPGFLLPFHLSLFPEKYIVEKV
jgi:hypothetical protein